MSTLTSQIFDDIVLKGMKPSDEQLHESGTDLKVLQQIYELYKPSMDHFTGYEHVTDHLWRTYPELDNSPWRQYREELHKSLSRQSRTLQLLFLGVQADLPYDKRGGGMRVLLLISLSGDWIVLTITPEYRHKVFKDFLPALSFIEALLPSDRPSGGFVHRISPEHAWIEGYNTRSAVPSLALAAARSLHEAFVRSSDSKQERLDTERVRQSSGAELLSGTEAPDKAAMH